LVFIQRRSKLNFSVEVIMAASNSVIAIDPEILGGTPVFRGTRVPFQSLLDYLEGGQTLNDFLDDFPTVTREVAIQALEHAKALVVSELR
jgi:uncharacterized protein (DUF433 family)